jgi:hypothetical protein
LAPVVEPVAPILDAVGGSVTTVVDGVTRPVVEAVDDVLRLPRR